MTRSSDAENREQSALASSDEFVTHQVSNQSRPLIDFNVFSTNAALMEAVDRGHAAWAFDTLSEFGQKLGSSEYQRLAAQANKYQPVLQTFDRFGNRIDEVEFHPAYHEVLGMAVQYGVHSSPWSDPKPGAHVARAALAYMQSAIEPGIQCPISMTYGSVPSLAKRADIAQTWLPKLYSRLYDSRFQPIERKLGALIGMGMTEKQGGSDVRANTTRATATGNPDREYDIVGHKWFFSAPMCDGFLILAQTKEGLSCFFLPRWLPDGSKNKIAIQRLKEKLGNRSNASSEVEFQHACGWLIGEAGRGVPTIIDMATFTRLDCALGSAGLMQHAAALAINHAAYRQAFGKRLIDHSLMKNVLADLVLEVEGATALAMRVAMAFDRGSDESETHLKRVITPLAKYWICKRGPTVAAEAMEVLGGNGYVEEGGMARIYREMPLNSIWEGSGNIMCLDVLRALSKSDEVFSAVRTLWSDIKGTNATLDAYARELETEIARLQSDALEANARRIAERLALCITASLLVKHAPPSVSDGFCASRLDHDWGHALGSLNGNTPFDEIIERGRPIEHRRVGGKVEATL
ncbi:MAG TPA: isovaleryl-CoA dehydrogenase [Chroococcales cyanobacterium]